jgi:hypothetical protein
VPNYSYHSPLLTDNDGVFSGRRCGRYRQPASARGEVTVRNALALRDSCGNLIMKAMSTTTIWGVHLVAIRHSCVCSSEAETVSITTFPVLVIQTNPVFDGHKDFQLCDSGSAHRVCHLTKRVTCLSLLPRLRGSSGRGSHLTGSSITATI